MAGVDDLGEQPRAGHQVDPQRPGGPHLGGVGLDGRRVHEAVEASRDGATVVGTQLDAQLVEAGSQILVLALIERAVGALDVVAAGAHQLGEGVHAGSGDTREVIAEGVPRRVGHARECSASARFRLLGPHDVLPVYRWPSLGSERFLSRRHSTLSGT
jgi:hypothetical protein